MSEQTANAPAANAPAEWADALAERIGRDNVLSVEEQLGQNIITVAPEKLIDALTVIRQAGFRRVCDITAVDMMPMRPRFLVVYHLWSHEDDRMLRIKAPVIKEPPSVPSATGVFPAADWHERETYDLFGIVFEGHPDLQRILLPDNWTDHPLRKDFPLEGRAQGPLTRTEEPSDHTGTR